MTIRLVSMDGAAVQPKPPSADPSFSVLSDTLRSACEDLIAAPNHVARNRISEAALCLWLRHLDLSGNAKPIPHPDAQLLNLAAQLCREHDKLIAKPSLDRRRRMEDIAATMAISRSSTIEGIALKGKALKLCYYGEDGGFQPLDFSTSTGRLFISLLHDLDKFGG